MNYDPKTAFGNPGLIAQAKYQAAQEERLKHVVTAEDWSKEIRIYGHSVCPSCKYKKPFFFDEDLYDFDECCSNCHQKYVVQLD
jgi:hypothetical protein